jgi:hypothetical protein
MFWHDFIDCLKECGDFPLPIAKTIAGQGLNASEFARYGLVGYTLKQKSGDCELHPKSWTPIQHLGCFLWRSTTRNLRNQ